MAIIRSALKLIVKAHGEYQFSGRMLTLGMPDVYVTPKELGEWSEEFASNRLTVVPEITTNKIGQKLGWISGRKFFEAFGFDAIDSLDIPGSEHPAEILHDLNEPLPNDLCGKYNFLMDPGTLEHVFDQRQCLENIHRALAVGGVVCHFVPIYSYNGGYYSVNPNVINDFYALNGFGESQTYILMWDRYKAFSPGLTLCYNYSDAILGSRHALADHDQVRYTPHLLYFARKLSEPEKIQCPIQFDGNYVGEAAALKIARASGLEQKGKKIATFARKFLPFHLVIFLQSWAYRELVLRRARREASFWI